MSQRSLVSVVLPSHNSAATLREAIDSVREQSWPDWELLIVDDGSTDSTLETAHQAAKEDDRIQVLSHPVQRGTAQARNTAIEQASGRYIAFLDSDDLWTPDKLSRQIPFMQKEGVPFGYTGFWREKDGQRHLVRVPESVDRHALLRSNVIGCLTAVYDQQALGKQTMPDYRLRQDFATWLDILLKTPRAAGLDEPLAIKRNQPNSLASSFFRSQAATWRVYRHHVGLSPPKAAWCMTQHLLTRLRRG